MYLYVHVCTYIPMYICITILLYIVNLFQGGFAMEVCLTQYWSEVKEATVSLKLTFHSVQPNTTALVFVSY